MKKLYILNEYYKREFHSNLLLAVQAASKNFEVYLGTMDVYDELLNKKLIQPGIFHTKSVTHDKHKSDLNKYLKELNFKLTVHDQEHGILENNYKSFCNTRVSNDDLAYFDAFFCWGKFDYNFLKKTFKISSNKFFLTGSPRVDLWKNKFEGYLDKKYSKKKYFLIITNFSTSNNINGFKKVLKKAKKAGYYRRYPKALNDDLFFYKYQKKLMSKYILMIKKLSKQFPDKNIILRPHPTENSKFWKVKFKNYKNIFIQHDGILSSLISNAEIIIQSGCTSSIESFICKKKFINYLPINKNIKVGNFVKKISINIYNLNNLIIFLKNPKTNYYNSNARKDLNDRTMFLKKDYAVKKMVKIFSKLKIHEFTNNKDFFILFHIKVLSNIKKCIKYLILLILNKKKIINVIEHKFFALENKEIALNIKKFSGMLRVKKKIKFKIFSDKFLKIYSD